MDLFDKIRKAWQRENDRIVLSGDPQQAIKKVRRREREFLIGLILSDVLEAGVGIVMAFAYVFYFAPLCTKAGFLLYIGAAALLLLSLFFIIDRIRQERGWHGLYNGTAVLLLLSALFIVHRVRPERGWQSRSLADEIRHYLLRVDRRIYLLKNVFWWYLLPCLIAWATLVGAALIETYPGWQKDPLGMAKAFGVAVLLAVVVFTAAYYLNQWAAKKYLQPRKQQLEQLLKDLAQETPVP